MASSRSAARGIADLAGTFATQGPAAALRQFNLDGLAGAPFTDVLVVLVDALCPPGGTIDEAIARDAMLETVAEMAAGGSVVNFDQLTPADLQEFFVGTVTRSIELRIFNEVGTNAISVPQDQAGVERVQRALHDFVDGCVRDRFAASGGTLATLPAAQRETFVNDLYAAALDLVQAMGEAS